LKAYSKEFYEAIEFFERCVAKSEPGSFRFDKPSVEERSRIPAGEWYNHGETNKAFRLFLHGAEFGKCVAAQEKEESGDTSANTARQAPETSAKITPDYSRCVNRKWNCVAFIKNCGPECYKPA
jgi:hypothetical protein